MSALGLSWTQRYWTRQRAKRAAYACYRRRWEISYSQGPRRWDYINHGCHPTKNGKVPRYADCSAIATGWLWDATRQYGLRDFVNGCNWQYGFTGTQIQHGVRVTGRKLVGDLVFYGYGPSHVAMFVGNGMVISHGSEAGPQLLRWNYRPVHSVRRYVR